MPVRTDRCPNMNHGRMNVPVRFCPNCRKVVNASIPATRCSEEKHQRSRRDRNVYCADCGEQLTQGA